MTKFIAMISILGLMTLQTLGNFYYTYGIWPKDWGNFFLFFVTGILLFLVFEKVRKEIDDDQ